MKALDRTSLIERISAQLKEHILSDTVVVGDKLPSEKEICEMLHVGRSSVREALRMLQTLGYIEIRHGRGAFIASKSISHEGGVFQWIFDHSLVFKEYMQVRSVLEVLAIKLAIDNITKKEIEELKKIYMLFCEAYAKRDVRSLVSCEEKFHGTIISSTRNGLLIDIYQRIANAFYPYREKSWGLGSRRLGSKRNVESHAKIMNAIERRDVKEATKSMQSHLREFTTAISKLSEDEI